MNVLWAGGRGGWGEKFGGPSVVKVGITDGRRLQAPYTALNLAAAVSRAPSGMSIDVMWASEQLCWHLPSDWNRTHMGAFCALLSRLGMRVSSSTGHPFSPGILDPKRSGYSTPAGSIQSATGSELGWFTDESFVAGVEPAVAFFFLDVLSGVTVPARLGLSAAVVAAVLSAVGSTTFKPWPSSSRSINSSALLVRYRGCPSVEMSSH